MRTMKHEKHEKHDKHDKHENHDKHNNHEMHDNHETHGYMKEKIMNNTIHELGPTICIWTFALISSKLLTDAPYLRTRPTSKKNVKGSQLGCRTWDLAENLCILYSLSRRIRI